MSLPLQNTVFPWLNLRSSLLYFVVVSQLSFAARLRDPSSRGRGPGRLALVGATCRKERESGWLVAARGL